jgi:hypothetical protein
MKRITDLLDVLTGMCTAFRKSIDDIDLEPDDDQLQDGVTQGLRAGIATLEPP